MKVGSFQQGAGPQKTRFYKLPDGLGMFESDVRGTKRQGSHGGGEKRVTEDPENGTEVRADV